MMKIVKSLSIIMAVVAVVAGGTYAAYHKEASLTGATYSADSMDIKIDTDARPDTYEWGSTLAAPNLFGSPLGSNKVKPGSTGEQIVDILRQGEVDGNATIKFHVAQDTPLYHNMDFVVKFDKNHDGSFETDVASGPLTSWNNNVYSMGKIEGNQADGISYGKIASVKIMWSVPATAGNEIMGESVVIDAIFGLDQI